MAAVSVRHLPSGAPVLARAVFWGLQPALLLAVLGTWLADPTNPSLLGLTLVTVHLLLGALEYRLPARPEWRHPAAEKFAIVSIAVVTFMIGGLASDLYTSTLSDPLDNLRAEQFKPRTSRVE